MPSEQGPFDLVYAVCALVAQTSAASTAHIQQPTQIGDTSFVLPPSDAKRLQKGQLVWFMDGGPDDPEINAGENVNPATAQPGPILISSVNNTTGEVELSWRGRSWSGLQVPHQANALISWNLFPGSPADTSAFLDMQDPSLWVYIDREQAAGVMAPNVNRFTRSVYVVYSIQIERPAALDDLSSIDANLWTLDQQNRARQDIWSLEQMFLTSNGAMLVVNGKPHAEYNAEGTTGLRLEVDFSRQVQQDQGSVALEISLHLFARQLD